MSISGNFTSSYFLIRINGRGISVRWRGETQFWEQNKMEQCANLGPITIKILKV